MPESPHGGQPSLLVFSDDWGRHPSSCQHLVRRLLHRYQVYWINTIGMRPPTVDRVTAVRVAEKFGRWFRPGRVLEGPQGNPRVVDPKMWPWFRGRFGRGVNRILLEKQLAPLIVQTSGPVVAITTVPIVADLMDRLPVHHWVYYCVDDFSKWPGLDQATIEKMEEQLVRRSDVLIAASERLQARIAERGRNSFLLTHGVDLGLWQKGQSATAGILEGIERPVVLFWGSVDWQMDLRFLRRLASDLSRGTIVLVGPRTDADPSLLTIPRVVWKPKVPYEQLPALAREASVLIMPYLDGPGLQESQPLKLKEYLASGKPAVVRDLPANRVWADALDLARTPEEFSEAVRRRLTEGLPASHAVARQRLARESWDDKTREFEEWSILSPLRQRTGGASDVV